MGSVVGWGQNPVVDECFYELSHIHYDSCVQLNVFGGECKARVVIFTSISDVDVYLSLKAEGSPRVACEVSVYVACAWQDDLPALASYMNEMGVTSTACLVLDVKSDLCAGGGLFTANVDFMFGLIEEHMKIGEPINSAQYWCRRMLSLLVACENYCEYNESPEIYQLVENARLLDFSENAKTAEFWRKEAFTFSQSVGDVFGVDVGDFSLLTCPVANASSLVSFIDFDSGYA